MVYTVFFYLFLLTAAVSFFVSLLAWKRRTVHGAKELARLMFFTGIYALFGAFEAGATTLEDKILWSKYAYIGAVSVPVLYFTFIMRFTGNRRFSSLKSTLLLFVLPIATLLLAFTNEYHHLVWRGFSSISKETNIVTYYHGRWFWLGYFTFDYVLLFFATVALFKYMVKHKSKYRVQGWIIFFAGLCPWTAGIIYLTDANPVPGLDITPASTMISGLMLIFAILKANLLDLVPVARGKLVETLQDGILVLDSRNRVQDINRMACLFLGLPNDRVLGKPIDSLKEVHRSLLEAVVSAKSFERFELDTGKETFVLKISKHNVSSDLNSRLIVIRDISGQIIRERALQESEERYRSMYKMFRLMADNMSDMLWAKDLNKKFIFVNKSLCDNLLLTSDTEEPIGKTDLFFWEREQAKHPNRTDWHNIGLACSESDDEVMRSQKSEHFDEYGNVKGEFMYLDVRKAPIMDEKGRMVGIVGSARDVTVQKKIELEIRKRDKLLNAIAKATDLMIQSDDLEESMHQSLEIIGEVIGINRIYVYHAELNSEKSLLMLELVYEWSDGLQKAKNQSWEVDYELFRTEFSDWWELLIQGRVCMGRTKDFNPKKRALLESMNVRSILIAPVFIDKKFWGLIGFDDCTNEREWTTTEERLLSTSAETLASAYVRKKNQIELIKAKEKAEESDRLKSAFLANISHEIRTPMNSILGFISLLQEPNLTGAEKDEYMDLVIKGGERLLSTIHDIIDISRLTSGQVDIEYIELNLNELMYGIHASYLPEAETKHLRFLRPVLVPEELAMISTDKNKIHSIMDNLVKNALKYTNEGFVEIGCDRTPGNVLFYVKDSGIGISESKRQVIFDQFVQADTSKTRGYEGAGLGLSIAKAYVEMLGGKIWVDSVENKGSTFYFQIPVIG